MSSFAHAPTPSDWRSGPLPRGAEELVRALRATAVEAAVDSPLAFYQPGDNPSIGERANLLFFVFKNFAPNIVQDIVQSMPSFYTMDALASMHDCCDHQPRA
jgi:hypothetical protein